MASGIFKMSLLICLICLDFTYKVIPGYDPSRVFFEGDFLYYSSQPATISMKFANADKAKPTNGRMHDGLPSRLARHATWHYVLIRIAIDFAKMAKPLRRSRLRCPATAPIADGSQHGALLSGPPAVKRT